jgi:hypothetical protein
MLRKGGELIATGQCPAPLGVWTGDPLSPQSYGKDSGRRGTLEMAKKKSFVEKWCEQLYESDLPAPAKFVGIAAATFADWDTGRNVRPGNARLVRMTGHGTRTVVRAYEQLEAAGFMKVVLRGRLPRPGNPRISTNRALTLPTADRAPTSASQSLVGNTVPIGPQDGLRPHSPTTKASQAHHPFRTGGVGNRRRLVPPTGPAAERFVEELLASPHRDAVEALLASGRREIPDETAELWAKEVGSTVRKLLDGGVFSEFNSMLRLSIPEDGDTPIHDDDGARLWVHRRGLSLTCGCPDSPGCRHVERVRAAWA